MGVIYKNGIAYGKNGENGKDGKDGTSIVKNATLSASGWASNTYILEDADITADSVNYIFINTSVTNEQLKAYQKAVILADDTQQADGQIVLVARGTIPTIDIPIVMTIQVASEVVMGKDAIPTDGSNNTITSDGVYHAINDARYINHESTPAWTSNATNVASTTSGMNIKNGFVNLILNITTNVAMTSGTVYPVFTLSDEIINIVGHTYVNAIGASGASIVQVTFNTWDTGNSISVTPRAALSKGANIIGNFSFPIT